MKPCLTRLTCSLFLVIIVACVLRAQGTPITVAPASPAVLVGQTVQLTQSGAVVPVAIAAGAWHTCLMYTDHTIRCTGLNNQGEIGNNDYHAVSEPQLAQTTVTPTTLLIGNEHTCTWISDGTMQCWGTNYTGQLGDGTIGGFAMVPQAVHNISTAAKGVPGGYHTCALLTDATVQCWGRNQDGQIGNGDATTDVTLPTPVLNLGGPVVDLYAGGYHTCAVFGTDRTLKCWGRNARGQVGDGTIDTPITQPHTVVGLSGVNMLALGGYHSCALLQDATVACWGENANGQAGASGPYAATPTAVSGLTNVTELASGFRHSCAVTGDGVMRCWGQNDWGQLGDGTLTTTSTPVVVQGITNPVQIAGGWEHTCALMRDSSVQCWGGNDYGELGNGTSGAASLTPVTMHLTGLTWTSSDTSVATVNATGLVTGAGRGTATISVTDPFGNTGSVNVTVTDTESLAVVLQGDGSGSVGSAPAGIDCPATTCSALFNSGSQVTLTATPGGDSLFSGWTGCDSVSGATCTVAMSGARSVAASFERQRFALTAATSGDGSGTVTSSPVGIDCPSACSLTLVSGSHLTLTAAPGVNSLFSGWTGCDSVSGATCTVTMASARSVTAAFVLQRFALTVTKNGIGKGTVTSSPGGVNCGADCSGDFVVNTTVTLTPTANLGSIFLGWTGCDSTSGNTCTVRMNAAKSVNANFLGIPLS
jgi:alpha-tubulin suppressor-like RCC1 family protein